MAILVGMNELDWFLLSGMILGLVVVIYGFIRLIATRRITPSVIKPPDEKNQPHQNNKDNNRLGK